MCKIRLKIYDDTTENLLNLNPDIDTVSGKDFKFYLYYQDFTISSQTNIRFEIYVTQDIAVDNIFVVKEKTDLDSECKSVSNPICKDTDGDRLSDGEEAIVYETSTVEPYTHWVGYYVFNQLITGSDGLLETEDDNTDFKDSVDDYVSSVYEHTQIPTKVNYGEEPNGVGTNWVTDPDKLKSLLKIDHDNGMIGAVFIGHAPAVFYETSSKTYIVDWYYGDLDGTWGDSDSNGIYDSHTDPDGTSGLKDVFPEIWIGQLRPPIENDDTINPNWEDDTIASLNDYFSRAKNYLTTGYNTINDAFIIQDDKQIWNSYDYDGICLSYLTEEVTYVRKVYETTATNYLNMIKNNNFEFSHIECEGTPTDQSYINRLFYIMEDIHIDGYSTSTIVIIKKENNDFTGIEIQVGANQDSFYPDEQMRSYEAFPRQSRGDNMDTTVFSDMWFFIKPLTTGAKLRFAVKDINDETSAGRWEYLSGSSDINDDGWFEVGDGKELTVNEENDCRVNFRDTVLADGTDAGGIVNTITDFKIELSANSNWFIGGKANCLLWEVIGSKIDYDDIANFNTYFYKIESCRSAKYADETNELETTTDKYISGCYVLKIGCGKGLGVIGHSATISGFMSDNSDFYNWLNRGYSIGTACLHYYKNVQSGSVVYDQTIIYIGDPVLRV